MHLEISYSLRLKLYVIFKKQNLYIYLEVSYYIRLKIICRLKLVIWSTKQAYIPKTKVYMIR